MLLKLLSILFNRQTKKKVVVPLPQPPPLREQPMKTQTKSLFISAGHSFSDPGAVGNGLVEAGIVLEFRDMLADELVDRGIEFTRDGVYNQNLPLRDAIVLAKGKDIALEFHCNAFYKPTATGVETLSRIHHYPLANKICSLISDTLGIANRGAKGEGSGQHSRLGFISKADGIIVELFFISNPKDVEPYQKNKQLLASRLADLLVEQVLE